MTYPSRIANAKDSFYRIADGQRPWIAALDQDGCGLIQTSTARQRGRKLFVWGMGPGGRRWQDFLSEPQNPYFEIQAGLARTQTECLPMPAESQWDWLEAYGWMQAEPAIVHGIRWDLACTEVERHLNNRLPEARLESERMRTAATTQRPPQEILQMGSGWGALERIRREHHGEKPFCDAGLVFGDDSLTEPQQPWQKLLETDNLPSHDPAEPPAAFMVQKEWRELLERAVEHKSSDHWLSWLHIGIMHYAAKDTEKARQAWQKSLMRDPSVWAHRNLALLAQDDGEIDQALEQMHQAWLMKKNLAPLAVEYAELMIATSRWERFHEFLTDIEPLVHAHPRIQLARALAALNAGDLDRVEAYLTHAEIPNLREGELTLTNLWYSLHEHRLARTEDIPLDDQLRQRVRREYPPPVQIDFRMS